MFGCCNMLNVMVVNKCEFKVVVFGGGFWGIIVVFICVCCGLIL